MQEALGILEKASNSCVLQPTVAILCGDVSLEQDNADACCQLRKGGAMPDVFTQWHTQTSGAALSGDVAFDRGCESIHFDVAIGRSYENRGIRNDCHDFFALSLAIPMADGGASQHSGARESGAPQPAANLRLRRKTTVTPGVRKPAFNKQSQRPAWFPGIFRALSAKERACVASFAGAFRKAAAMDFYITKYQGKPMETLTPLFQCMTDGVIRLERQEEVEEAEAEEAEAETDGDPAPKKRKTKEDVIRRARRLTLSLIHI